MQAGRKSSACSNTLSLSLSLINTKAVAAAGNLSLRPRLTLGLPTSALCPLSVDIGSIRRYCHHKMKFCYPAAAHVGEGERRGR